jgi:peptidoglycan-associated lipoprotein
MKTQRRQALVTWNFAASFILLVVVLLLSACAATPQTDPAAVVLPPLANSPANVASTHSPSAIEALSRGIAAVTPPGAALKDIYYSFDSTNLLGEAEEILKQNAEWMKAHPKSRVEIEGHCDDVGSAEYNLALGAKRAQIARDFLVSQGVAAERLVTISYGKEAPACFELTEACRVQNRRARFVIFTELPHS